MDGISSGFETMEGATGGDAERRGAGPEPKSAAAPGQDYLISELIAFIPPAISAQSGIPMTRELRIPFPADGSRDVKLSTIYQLCPELFAAEITPLNDSVVTLPPKIGAMGGVPDSSPMEENLPIGFSAASPASSNPFWSPTATAAEEKGESAPKSGGLINELSLLGRDDTFSKPKGSSLGLDPFSDALSPADLPAKTNPPAGAVPLMEPKIPGEFENSAAAPQGGDKPLSGVKSGFQSPPSALFGGKGTGFAQKAEEKGSDPLKTEEPFQTLFSKQANVDKDIPCPTSEEPRPARETDESGDEQRGVWGAMFQGGGFPDLDDARTGKEKPFSPPALENIGNLLKQAGGSGVGIPFPASEPAVAPISAPMTSDQPIPTGFTSFEADPDPQEAAPATPKSSPAPAQQALSSSPGTSPFIAPSQIFAGFGADPAPELSPINTFGAAPAFEPLDLTKPAPSVVGGAAADSVSIPVATPNSESAPNPEPEPARAARGREEVASAPAREIAPAPPQSGDELRDLELRAIFSTSEVFTLSMVARRIVGLPGVINCTLSTPGKLVQASKSDSGRVGNEAREMVATLRNLAKLTGLPEARTFTLHTDRGIVSLFLEGDCCVMVNHEAASFEPGVREKLILVARNLIKLEE